MKKITLLSALIIINLACFGQVSTYTFASSSGTYTPLSGGTPLIPPNTSLPGTGWTEQCYNVALPFVYYFNGIGYSSVFINSNGYVTFGRPTAVTNPRPHLVNNGQSGAIMGYACATAYQHSQTVAPLSTTYAGPVLLGGLLDRNNANPITYGTIGTAPNRIFIAQWTAAYRAILYYPTSGAGTESFTFQIRLYEGTNQAEVVYDASTTTYSTAVVASPFPAVVGLSGASTADFNLVGGTSWTTVTNNTVTTATNIPFTSTVSIPAGTTFTFTPPSGLMPTACSGTPSSPIALCNVGVACGPVSLSLSGLPKSTGLTYQWQISATGLANSWSNLSGATNASFTTTPTYSAHYQCLVACGSGTPVASSPIAVGYESSCPALPSYTYNLAGGFPYAGVGNFSIAGGACGSSLTDVSNSVSSYNYTTYAGTAGTPYNYIDYTYNYNHIKLQGSTSGNSTFTATINNFGSNAGVYGVWIDFNDDGSFTGTGEYVGSVASVSGVATAFTLTIPANTFGIHRMRLRGAFAGAYNTSTIQPTGSLNFFGMTHDYKVEVIPATPTASNNSPVCVTGTAILTSASVAGATYTWMGPLSYYSTTSSATQNYTVPSTAASGTYNLYTTVKGANACSSAATTVTVNPQPSLTNATNSSPICDGSTLTLSANGPANVTGYSWTGPVAVTSATSASASVPGATPTASGTYTVAVNNGTGSGCTVNYTTTATVNPLPAAITGVLQACPGTSTTLSSSAGVSWTSSNTSIATVGSATGVVTGVSVGSATITCGFVTTGCYVTATVTINPLPAAIGANTPVCPGSTITLTNASSGGVWSSNNTSLATVGSSSGIVSGISSGNPVITYTLPTGCSSAAVVTVISTPAITGSLGICSGYTSALGNPISGGTWTSSNAGVASVGSSSGIVTGVSAGSAVITYTFPSSCTITATVGVTATPGVFTVTGGGTACSGSTGAHIFLSGSDAGVSYQLYVGGVPTGTAIPGTGSSIDFGPQATTGTYTVVANPGSPCATNMTSSATITAYAAPTAYTVTGGGAYCAGGSGVTVGLSGSNTGFTYQLYYNSSALGSPVSGTSTILNFGLMTAVGTYTVVATNTTTGCTGSMAGSVSVSVNPLPSVYAMTGTNSYCAGGTGVEIGLSNSDAGINYQLYRGSTPVGSTIAGVGFALNYGYQTIAGSYTTVATNASTGCTSAMSGAAIITVNALPTIYSVTGGGSFCVGGTGVAVGLGGSSTGVNYQLLYNGVSSGTPVSGTGSPISFGLKTGTGVYTVVATTTAGCSSSMLGSATVSTNPLPAVFNVTGGGNYCLGTSGVPVGLSGSVVGTNYYLYRGSTLVGGASGTSAALDFGLFTTPGVYTVSATLPGTGCNTTMNGSVTISVHPSPNIYTVSGGGSFCSGGSGFGIGLGGSETGVNYILLNTGVGLSFTSLPGTGSSLNFGVFTTPSVYTVFAVNATTGCTNTMTGSATIVVNPLPTAYAVTGGGNYCVGGAGVPVGLGGSAVGVNYRLYKDGVAVGAIMAGTGSAIDFGMKTATGVYTVRATDAVTGCVNMMSGSVNVNTDALPVANVVTGGGSYCAGGGGMPIGLDNSENGVSYQLMLGSAAAGSPLMGTTGSAVDFGPQTSAGTYTVVATNTATGCMNTMSGSAVIGINVLPAVYSVSGGGNYCVGGTGVNIGISGSTAGISYQLYNAGSPAGTAVTGTGFAFNFGLQTVAGSYTVTATNLSTGCSSNMTGSASVGTNPLPVTFAVTGGGNYCVGGTGVPVGLISSVAGTSYQLQLGGTPIGASMAGTGSTLNFGPQTIAGVYTVSAINTATGCMNNMSGSVPVVINPLPIVYSVMGGGNYCPGGTGVPVGLGSSTIGVNYQLYNGSLMVGPAMAGDGSAIDFGLQTAPGTYTVAATHALAGCTQNMTGSVSVAVSSMPNVYSVTGGGNYCPSGSGVHVGLSSSDIWMNYQLYHNSVAVGSAVVGTGSALDFGSQTVAGTYTVVAVGLGTTTCTGNMSGSAMVGINTLPSMHTVTGGGNYCAGDAGIAIGLDGSNTGISYQLYNGGSATGMPMTGTGSDISFGSQTASGSYTVKATDIATGCNINMTGSAGIAIDPLPNVYTVTGGGHYCIGGMGVAVGLSNSDLGISYQLLNGGAPSGTGAGTTLALDFGLQTATGNYTVVATNPANGCVSNMSGAVNVATDPLPAVFTVSGGGNYCAGGTGVHVMLDGSATGVTYQLITATAPSGTAVAGTGSSLDFGLRTTPGTYTVEATSTATGCVSTMTDAATITASALPIAYTVSGSSAGYCTGGPGVMVSVSGSETGVDYLLYRGGSPASLAVPGTGAPLSMGTHTVAGAYTVVGINATTGCTSNMTGGASISINPLPNVYTVTGGGSYCNGDAGVHIGLSGSVAGTSYQLYRASIAIGGAVTGTGSPLDFGFQATAGNYTVIATNITTGCVSTMTGSATVVVNTLPGLYAVTGGGSYCDGGTGVAAGLSGSAAGILYQLHHDGTAIGAPMAGTAGPLNFGMQTAAGAYIIVAINSATGCSRTMAGSATVVVNPSPVVYTVTGGGNYCAGGTGVHVGIGGSNTGISYQLYRGSTMVGGAVTGTGSSMDFGLQTVAGNYTITATTGITGCRRAMAGSATVVVNSLPVVYTVTGGGNYCAGGAGVHVGLSNSASGVDYTLYNTGGPVTTVTGTGTALDFGLLPAGSYAAIAEHTASGCTQNMSGSAVVTATPTATPSVTLYTGMGDSVCAGRLVTFVATTANGGLAPMYEWAINGIALSTTADNYSYLPVNGDVVQVKLTSNANCASPAVVYNTMTMTVSTPEMPSVLVASDRGSEVCQGQSVTYSAAATYGGSLPRYTWKKNGATVGTSPTYSYIPANGDDVYCIVRSSYHCRLSDSAISNHVNMTVAVPVVPAVTISANPGLSIAPGVTEVLTATVTNSITAPTYQWLVNGTAIPGAIGQSYSNNTYANLDQVTCKVRSGGVCAGTEGTASVTITIWAAGVNGVASAFTDIRLVPNPNKGTFVVKGMLGAQDAKEVSVEITNMLGQVVYSGSIQSRNGEVNEQIQLSNALANGMYMLNLRSGTESKVFHMVVEQ